MSKKNKKYNLMNLEDKFFKSLNEHLDSIDIIRIDSKFLSDNENNRLIRYSNNNSSLWFSKSKIKSDEVIYYFGLKNDKSSIGNNVEIPKLILKFSNEPDKSNVCIINNIIYIYVEISKNSDEFKNSEFEFLKEKGNKNYFLVIGDLDSDILISNFEKLLYEFSFDLDLNKNILKIITFQLENIQSDMVDEEESLTLNKNVIDENENFSTYNSNDFFQLNNDFDYKIEMDLTNQNNLTFNERYINPDNKIKNYYTPTYSIDDDFLQILNEYEIPSENLIENKILNSLNFNINAFLLINKINRLILNQDDKNKLVNYIFIKNDLKNYIFSENILNQYDKEEIDDSYIFYILDTALNNVNDDYSDIINEINLLLNHKLLNNYLNQFDNKKTDLTQKDVVLDESVDDVDVVLDESVDDVDVVLDESVDDVGVVLDESVDDVGVVLDESVDDIGDEEIIYKIDNNYNFNEIADDLKSLLFLRDLYGLTNNGLAQILDLIEQDIINGMKNNEINLDYYIENYDSENVNDLEDYLNNLMNESTLINNLKNQYGLDLDMINDIYNVLKLEISEGDIYESDINNKLEYYFEKKNEQKNNLNILNHIKSKQLYKKSFLNDDEINQVFYKIEQEINIWVSFNSDVQESVQNQIDSKCDLIRSQARKQLESLTIQQKSFNDLLLKYNIPLFEKENIIKNIEYKINKGQLRSNEINWDLLVYEISKI